MYPTIFMMHRTSIPLMSGVRWMRMPSSSFESAEQQYPRNTASMSGWNGNKERKVVVADLVKTARLACEVLRF